ncbi:MAG: extracellular solute-binding protein [Ruminococcus sp.]|nr:extracellular solute-binding protein [Ruminococcus sp.]
MRRVAAFFLAALTLLAPASCSTAAPAESSRSVRIADVSRIYKKTELPAPDGIAAVTDLLYSSRSGRVYIIGTDSSGGVKCCLTDSTFAMYDYAELGISCTAGEESAVYALSGDRLYAAVLHVEHGGMQLTEDTDYDEYMRSAEYTYTLSVFDSSCKPLYTADIELGDDCRGLTGLQCTEDGRLLLCTGEDYLLIDGQGSLGYTSYYTDMAGFYGTRSDGSSDKLIDFANSGLSGLRCITPIAGGDFVCMDGRTLCRLSERDEAEFADIQELTLAVAGRTDSIQGSIADFNAQSTRYRVTVKNYSESFDYSIEGLDSALRELETDIITGDIPDMVWLPANETDKLSAKGAFANLYGFMDSDPAFPRDAFLPNYLEAAEVGGHLYSIAPMFWVETIAAKSKYVSAPDWTFDEFAEVYASLPEGMELFESANNRVAVLSFLTADGADFVDYASHTCSFDSPDFTALLEFAAQFPSPEEYDWEQRSCRRDTALLSLMYISSFRDINKQKQCTFGDDITFAGFPSESGGSVLLMTEQFAVMAGSDNKAGAWEFIRSLLRDENFTGNIDGIPVTESGFELAMSEALEKPYYLDGGQKVYMEENGSDTYSNETVKVTPMTEADRARYERFIRGITRSASAAYDSQIDGIVSEETAAYFAGETTAARCAEIIQNRVSILLSEQL